MLVVQLGAGLELADQLGVRREAGRVVGEVVEDRVEACPRRRRSATCGSTPSGFGGFGALTDLGRVRPGLVERDLQLGLEVGERLLGLLDA